MINNKMIDNYDVIVTEYVTNNNVNWILKDRFKLVHIWTGI